MSKPLIEKLDRTSSFPGVYLMKNSKGSVIYVGKARNLKKRLASYFTRARPLDMKTGVMIKHIADFDTIITETEKEALILESNLIKRYRPRYNVVLKDDKRYPVLRMDARETYPNLTIARKIKNDGALYFGPYASAYAVRQTLKFIHKTFKIRKCRSKNIQPRTRPCLHCQIEGCHAPCCMDVLELDYNKVVKEVILFLQGKTPELIRDLKNEMKKAAAEQNFEKAAKLRDKMFSLEKTLEKQVSVTADFTDRDVLAVSSKPGWYMITQFMIRSGFLVGSRNYDFFDDLASGDEILEAFIKQHYEKEQFIPKEILLPNLIGDREIVEEWLSALKGQRVKLLRPQRGEKARLVRMAAQNAANALQELIASSSASRSILTQLQKSLRMNQIPERIECFDNSNISGAQPSAGMVVFENAKPKKSAYRKFKIKNVKNQDDYAYMREVLQRRFRKGEKEGFPFPDILMVDGGKGQLGIALSVLKEMELSGKFKLIGIAKKDQKRGENKDKIYIPGRVNPVNISNEALLLLQRIRDEAHRFAITYHRNRRKKAMTHSALDDIPGVGKIRKKALLKKFGSLTQIKNASLDEISSLPQFNRKIAEKILNSLNQLEQT